MSVPDETREKIRERESELEELADSDLAASYVGEVLLTLIEE